ncbi:tRNA pseudouridine synthase B, partial [Xanthomonas hyacinthi DSM 19077]
AAGLADFPPLRLDHAAAQRFRMGQRLRDAAWAPGAVAVFGADDVPLGLGQVDASGLLAPQRMFNL